MKHKQIYIDKNGNSFEPSSAKVKIVERHQTYVMILKGDAILCIYDREAEILLCLSLYEGAGAEINREKINMLRFKLARLREMRIMRR